MEDKIYLFALQNAIKYEGTANAKGLFGRVMGEFPEARKNAKKTQELIYVLLYHLFGLEEMSRVLHEV